MHSKTPPRNRLAKALPESWRKVFVERGVPKRKYAAIVQITLAGGRVIDDVPDGFQLPVELLRAVDRPWETFLLP